MVSDQQMISGGGNVGPVTSQVQMTHQLITSLSSLCSSTPKRESSQEVAQRFVQALRDVRLADHVQLRLGKHRAGEPAPFEIDEDSHDRGGRGTWVEGEGRGSAWVLAPHTRAQLLLCWNGSVDDGHRQTLDGLADFLLLCLKHFLVDNEGTTGWPVGLDLFALAGLLAKANSIAELLSTVLETLVRLSGATGGRVELLGHAPQIAECGELTGSQLLLCPIHCHEQVRALVRLHFACEKPPTAEQIGMLESFATQIGLALENALNHEREREEAHEAQLLYKAARTIEEGSDLDEVLEYSAGALAELAEVSRCLILLKDDHRPQFSVVAATGLSEDQHEFFAEFRLPLNQLSEGTRALLLDGRPVRYEAGGAEEAGLEKLCQLLPGKACMIVPLLVKERLIGLIYLDDSTAQVRHSERASRLVLTLSLQVGNAIQRASLINQLQENLGPLRALYQVSTAITGTLSLSKVVKLIVEQAVDLLEHSACAVLVLDEMGEGFRLETSVGLTGELLEPALHAKMARQAVEKKKAVTLYLDKDTETEEFRPVLERSEFGGLLSVPLIARKKMVGVLNCFVPPRFRFRQQEVRFLRGFANQAAIAVENARLHGLIRFKMGELGTLFEVSKAVTSTLKLDVVLQEIVRHVLDILRADGCSLMLLEGERLVLKTSDGFDGKFRCQPIQLGKGVAGIAAKTGQPMVLLDHPDSNPDDFPSKVRGFGLKTILCVPVEARGKVIGVINVYYREMMTHTPAQINLLTTLGSQAAVAIENARLYAEKERTTELLRNALIPKEALAIPGLEVGHRFLPSMDLSGDYYDVIPIDKHRCLLVIADVSGKGPDAAIHTLQAKQAVRCFTAAGYSPGRCLEMLNRQVATNADARQVSMFCAMVDLESRQLTYASAGHEQPVFWCAQSKEAHLLAAEGILIGALDEAEYEEKTIPLAPDSVLLLYTDGITEARNGRGEFFGVERVLDIVKHNAFDRAQRLVDVLYNRVRKFSREKTADDLSILGVRF